MIDSLTASHGRWYVPKRRRPNDESGTASRSRGCLGGQETTGEIPESLDIDEATLSDATGRDHRDHVARGKKAHHPYYRAIGASGKEVTIDTSLRLSKSPGPCRSIYKVTYFTVMSTPSAKKLGPFDLRRWHRNAITVCQYICYSPLVAHPAMPSFSSITCDAGCRCSWEPESRDQGGHGLMPETSFSAFAGSLTPNTSISDGRSPVLP